MATAMSGLLGANALMPFITSARSAMNTMACQGVPAQLSPIFVCLNPAWLASAVGLNSQSAASSRFGLQALSQFVKLVDDLIGSLLLHYFIPFPTATGAC